MVKALIVLETSILSKKNYELLAVFWIFGSLQENEQFRSLYNDEFMSDIMRFVVFFTKADRILVVVPLMIIIEKCCENYRGISLLYTYYKKLSKIIEKKNYCWQIPRRISTWKIND